MFSKVLNSDIYNRSIFKTIRELYAFPEREDDETQDDDENDNDDY